MIASTASSSCAPPHGGGVALRVGVAEHVDRIADAGRRGQLLPAAQWPCYGRQPATSRPDFSTASAAMMPGPAGVGDDGHPVALGQGCMAKAMA